MLRGLRGVKFVQRQFIACRWKQTEADGPFNEDYLKPQVGKPFSEVPQTDNLKFLRDTQLEVNKASKERPEMDLFFGKMIDNYGNVIRVDQPEIANIFTSNPDDFAITFRAKGTDGTQTAKGTQFVRAYKQKRNIPPGLFDADDINEVQAALATIYEHPALLSKETTDMFKVYSDRIIEIVKKHLDPYTKTTNNLNEMLIFWHFHCGAWLMFGKPDLETQLDFADFLNVFAHQSYLASQLHVSWFARWIPTPSWFKYCQNADFLYGQIREFAKFQSSSPNSFSVYSELSKIYGEDRAVSICYDLNSSSLRTGLATWWLLYDVARFSDVQSRLKKEFQEVPEYSDRKFLHAVLKESYRVHPLQLVQAKRVTEETKIGGYEIPADTVHSSLTGLTAKSEKYFNEPLQFLPDRWLDGSKIHPFASTPFGAGSRKCPGETVANLQISILLERVLQAFELDADPTEVAEAQYGPLLTPVLPLDIAFKSIRSSDDAESGDEDIS